MKKQNEINKKKFVVVNELNAPFINGLNRLMSSMLEFQPITSSRFCCSSQAFNGWKKFNSASAESRDVLPLVRIFSNCDDVKDEPCCMISLEKRKRFFSNAHDKHSTSRKCLVSPQHTANLTRSVEIACVQRTNVVDGLTKLWINLKLQYGRDEVFYIILIADHLIFCACIEIVLSALRGWHHTQISQLQFPPTDIHFRIGALLEYVPSPFLQCQTECKERQLLQCHR